MGAVAVSQACAPPARFFAFLWRCAAGVRPHLLAVTLFTAGIAAAAALLRGLNTPGAAIYGKNNKATAALLRSAKAFRGAKRRGPLTGVDAELLLQASQALIPAFDSYGPLLSRAARADLTGNVRKLRKAGGVEAQRDELVAHSALVLAGV